MAHADIQQFDYSGEYFEKMSSGWNKLSFFIIASFAKEGLSLFSPQSILDVGCGNGIYGPVLHQKGAKLFGIDVSPQSICISKTLGYDHLLLSSADSIAVIDEKFDMVFCSEVLEHVENYNKMLEEIHRVLKSDGGLVLTTTCYATSIYQFLFYKEKSYVEWGRNLSLYLRGFFNLSARQTFVRRWCFKSLGGHYHGFMQRELRKHIERIGFDIIRSDIFYAINPFPVVDGYCFMSVMKSRKSIIKKMVLLLLLAIAPLLKTICRFLNILGNNLVIIARKR